MVSPPCSPLSKKLKMQTTSASDEEDEAPNPQAPVSSEPRRRYKRRKIAIFLAYCGAGYQGMQKNPGAKTIESDLEEALFLSGAVPEPDRGKPKRFDWARSARTDKGVSAVGQVVSGRFYVDPPGLVDRLNDNLSPQIRIFGFKRVTASFNAKKFCDRRRYVYLLPVFALDPNAHPDRESVMASMGSENELVKCLECSERGRKIVGLMGRQPMVLKEEEDCGLGNASSLATSETPVSIEGEEAELGRGEVALGENKENEAAIDSMVAAVEEKAEHWGVSDSKLESRLESTEPGQYGNGSAVSNSESLLEPSAPENEEKTEPGNENLNRQKLQNLSGDDTFHSLHLSSGDSTVDTGVKEEGKLDSVCGNRGQTQVVPSEFQFGEKEKERLNGILRRYVGTHNFHNFTTRTKAEDPSARRYIISFDANRVVDVEGFEFVKCEVIGQSFMLHQIRKMIGLAVAIMRNCAPESLMDIALRKDVNINVPTAPEVGLYLEECLFTSYNQKWKDSHEELSMDAYAEESEDFKMKHIHTHIASMEQKEGAVALWLHSLNHRNYPDFKLFEANGADTVRECTQIENTAH